MYEREMTEVRSSKQVEISEIDGRLQEQYQARLQSALQDLREHYESQMKQNREEVEGLYQTKVSARLDMFWSVLPSNALFSNPLGTRFGRPGS